MSSVIQDLYLQAHGATVLMRDWSAQQRASRPDWPLADHLSTCQEMFDKAFRQFDVYRRTGTFEDPRARFCDFAEMLRELLAMSDVALHLTRADTALTRSAVELERSMSQAREILTEDSHATEMAMLSLDDEE